MATEGLDRVTLRAWWSIGSNAVAFAVVAPGIFFGFFDAADPSPRRWVTAILASAPAWWVLVRSPRLSLTLDFSSGRGQYRGLTHDVRFDLADVTVLESIWPGWPFGQFSNTDNGVRVRFRSRRSLKLNGLSGYGTDYALDIKRAMGRGGYRDVVLSTEEIGLFRGLIPRRPDRERSADVTGGEP